MAAGKRVWGIIVGQGRKIKENIQKWEDDTIAEREKYLQHEREKEAAKYMD